MISDDLYKKVCSYCAKAERCPQEVEEWLRRHQVEEMSELVVERLKEERFIDEERFIHAYCADKLRFSGWGPFKIKHELYRRDLPEGLVDRIVSVVQEEEDARAILQRLLVKRLSMLSDPSPEEIQRKVIGWAMNKGFYLEDILSILKELRAS